MKAGPVRVGSTAGPPRAGWADAARRMRRRDEDELLDEPTRTRFDDEEWQWSDS